jgi:3'-phosphoadenosine 5'-phosphosulfate sulfotransferase (PAPS reductase)/FAD synthetase
MTYPKPLQQFSAEQIEAALSRVPFLVEQAVGRLINAPYDRSSMYLGHSGGKDSVLVCYLAEQAFGNLPIIHNTKPTGVENAVHPLTQKFLYGLDKVVTYMPLKAEMPPELLTQIDGTRMSEWNREDGRSVDVIKDGKSVSRTELELYMTNGLFGRNFVYPIFDWSDAEVWAAIHYLAIPYSPEYEQ